jgi:hypothetical protein
MTLYSRGRVGMDGELVGVPPVEQRPLGVDLGEVVDVVGRRRRAGVPLQRVGLPFETPVFPDSYFCGAASRPASPAASRGRTATAGRPSGPAGQPGAAVLAPAGRQATGGAGTSPAGQVLDDIAPTRRMLEGWPSTLVTITDELSRRSGWSATNLGD